MFFIKREKPWSRGKKVLTITVVSALLSLICGIFEFVFPWYLTYKYNIVVNENSSLAIIGGADGPTATYTTFASSNSFPITSIFLLITIMGMGYGFFIRSKELNN